MAAWTARVVPLPQFLKGASPLPAGEQTTVAMNDDYDPEILRSMSLAELEKEFRDIDGKRVFLEGEYARVCGWREDVQNVIVEKLKDCGILAQVVKKE